MVTGALFQIDDIGSGKITEIVIDNAGTNYKLVIIYHLQIQEQMVMVSVL